MQAFRKSCDGRERRAIILSSTLRCCTHLTYNRRYGIELSPHIRIRYVKAIRSKVDLYLAAVVSG